MNLDLLGVGCGGGGGVSECFGIGRISEKWWFDYFVNGDPRT